MNKIKLIIPSIFFITISCKKEQQQIFTNPDQKVNHYQNELASTFFKIFTERNPNKDYVVSWKKEKSESHFKYIGTVINSKNEKVNILTLTRYEGEISRKAINYILILEDENKYIGYYYITVKNDLPNRMENGFLYFENVYNNCDKKITTKIDFNKEIPKKIFRKCEGAFGDLYEFQIDD